MSFYKAEYIWVDGGNLVKNDDPTPHVRSKTKVLPVGEEPDLWGFDGSSTNQAEGEDSDCVLKPVFVCPDPIRGENHKLVMCEVMLPPRDGEDEMRPHPSNTRAMCAEAAEKYADFDTWFGIEQEYTFMQGTHPLGWPDNGFPAPQGGYYCGVGYDEIFGRDTVEEHLKACLTAGLAISGINAEVMPAQWEFQIGPVGAPEVGDHLWIARWLLYRIAENYGYSATLDPKPMRGDWNGAGAHTNFSTKQMRAAYDPCVEAAEALKGNHEQHIANYGFRIEERLTGRHETCSYREFRYGVSDRGASVRIPWQVARDRKGYIEDRRPNANCDPYTVTGLILNTVCGAASGK